MSGTQSPRSARYARAARFALPLVLASGGLTALALGIGEPQTGGTPRMAPRSQAAADPPQAGPPLRAYRTASWTSTFTRTKEKMRQGISFASPADWIHSFWGKPRSLAN